MEKQDLNNACKTENFVCKTHAPNLISFFCYETECYMPLCSLCKQDHAETHKKKNTIPFLLDLHKVLFDTSQNLNQILKVLSSLMKEMKLYTKNETPIYVDGIESFNTLKEEPNIQNTNQPNELPNSSLSQHNSKQVVELTQELQLVIEKIVFYIDKLKGERAPNIISVMFSTRFLDLTTKLKLKIEKELSILKGHTNNSYIMQTSSFSLSNLNKEKTEPKLNDKYAQTYTSLLSKAYLLNSNPTSIILADNQHKIIAYDKFADPQKIKDFIPSIEIESEEDESESDHNSDLSPIRGKQKSFDSFQSGSFVESDSEECSMWPSNTDNEEAMKNKVQSKVNEKTQPVSDFGYCGLDTKTSLGQSPRTISALISGQTEKFAKAVCNLPNDPNYVKKISNDDTFDEDDA